MSTVYTPAAVQLGPITIPSDGDPAAAASVNAPIQAIADGVTYLNPVAAYMLPLADLTALAAITTPADGRVCHVLSFGTFVFKTSATSGFSPFRVAAADATVGGWVSSTNHQTSLTRYLTLNKDVRISALSGAITAILASVGLQNNVDYANPTVAQAGMSDRGFYSNIVYGAGAGSYAWSVPLDAALVDGSTLSSATLHFRPVGGHAAVPTVQPWFGILRNVRTSYNPVSEKMKSGTTGYTQLAAASVAAYQVDQAMVFTPDQNNVIDLSTYSYLLVIGDEGAGNMLAGCRFAQVGLSMTGIPDARR